MSDTQVIQHLWDRKDIMADDDTPLNKFLCGNLRRMAACGFLLIPCRGDGNCGIYAALRYIYITQSPLPDSLKKKENQVLSMSETLANSLRAKFQDPAFRQSKGEISPEAVNQLCAALCPGIPPLPLIRFVEDKNFYFESQVMPSEVFLIFTARHFFLAVAPTDPDDA